MNLLKYYRTRDKVFHIVGINMNVAQIYALDKHKIVRIGVVMAEQQKTESVDIFFSGVAQH